MGQNSEAKIIISFKVENESKYKYLIDWLNEEGWEQDGNTVSVSGKYKITLKK